MLSAFRSLLRPAPRPAPRSAPRRPAARPLRVESLDDRTLPSAAVSSALGVWSSTAWDTASDNAVDAAGNTFLTGTLRGTTNFDPSGRVADGSATLTPRGASDAFVAKYAPDGSLAWARRMGGDTDLDHGARLAVDRAGNAYVTGSFGGPADFGPLTRTGATGDADAFVAKLDPAGNFVWVNRFGGSTSNHGNGIAVDPTGNVLAVGSSVTYDYAAQKWTVSSQIQKYSGSGATLWSAVVATNSTVSSFAAQGVAADAGGNVFVCGGFAGTADFDPDPRKAAYATGGADGNGFVLKLTAAGKFGWVAPFVSKTAESAGSFVVPADIAVDGGGNVVVGGYYTGAIDFNPSPAVDYRLPLGRDGFVAKLSPGGSLAWASGMGGAEVLSVAVDAAGSVYAAGDFKTLNPEAGVTVTSTGGGVYSDAYVGKLSAAGRTEWYLTFGGTGGDSAGGIVVDAAGSIHVAGNYRYAVDLDGTHQLPGGANYENMFVIALTQS